VPRVGAAIVPAIAALLISTPAGAQSSPSSSPGPYVIDIRAPMSGVPRDSAFHPDLPANTLLPKRGFGVGVGGHVYLTSLGIARIGVGADLLRVRGTGATPVADATSSTATTTPATTSTSALSANDQIDTETTITAIAPQVSFNFGTGDGWSYLSAGYGAADIRSSASGTPLGPLAGRVTLVRDDGRAAAINYGGGARWFIRGHVAVGFDLRFHRVAALGTRPGTKLTVLSAGVSLR
jgi:hypothetical protein